MGWTTSGRLQLFATGRNGQGANIQVGLNFNAQSKQRGHWTKDPSDPADSHVKVSAATSLRQ